MSKDAVIKLLREEMGTRKWSAREVALRHVPHDVQVKELEVGLLLHCGEGDPNVIIGDDTLDGLDRAFGLSEGFCRRLYRA